MEIVEPFCFLHMLDMEHLIVKISFLKYETDRDTMG